MIRRSTAIAIAAIVVSMLVHFLGLTFSPVIQSQQSATDTAPDAVAMGNAFEDLAEIRSEPVQPDAAPVPEPPVEAPPEPEVAETPTSDALVASANPQRVFAPDSGSARVVKPDTAGPSELTQAGSPEPETIEPAGGDDGTVAEATGTPPVAPDTIVQAPVGEPDAPADTPESADPTETASVEPTETAKPTEATAAEPVPVSPALQLAALPPEVAPVPPVTPAPDPTVAAVPQPERETVEPVPDDPASAEIDENTPESDLAVAASPRPRPREDRPTDPPQGLRDNPSDFSDLRFPPLIESPLTAYLRGQGDLNVRQNAGTQSGGAGFQESRGPGNSDVTNYAGQVLMHLNRTPPVRVSAKGFVRVFFEINADGSLAWVDVIDGTRSHEIERAAKEQVRIAAPFPRPPNGAKRKLSFVYRID